MRIHQINCQYQTKKIILLLLFFIICNINLNISAYADAIDDLKPGHWLEIPNSNLDQVSPNPIPAGSTGVMSVMEAWSGGAYDTKRDRLIIWGGGHTNYAGNELYVFDLNTLQWTRLTEPSSLDGWTDGDKEYSDGRPISRHTYDYIEYLPPPYDQFFTGGGAGLWRGGSDDNTTFIFDFQTNKWIKEANPTPNPGLGAITVYDKVTEKIWMHNAGKGSFLSEFDPKTKKWKKRGSVWTEPDGWIDYYWSGAIDPIRRKFVAIGNGNLYVWDLTEKGDIGNTKPVTTGNTEILSMQSPGFQYDPVSDEFIAWHGGENIYTLNMDNMAWKKIAPAPSNVVIPTPAAKAGTFGRFRYVPSRNVFIAVNRVTENVYIYRHTAPLSATAPHQPSRPNAQ